jgi:hypothetical protein
LTRGVTGQLASYGTPALFFLKPSQPVSDSTAKVNPRRRAVGEKTIFERTEIAATAKNGDGYIIALASNFSTAASSRKDIMKKIRWGKPAKGMVKLNVGVSFIEESKSGATGVVLFFLNKQRRLRRHSLKLSAEYTVDYIALEKKILQD